MASSSLDRIVALLAPLTTAATHGGHERTQHVALTKMTLDHYAAPPPANVALEPASASTSSSSARLLDYLVDYLAAHRIPFVFDMGLDEAAAKDGAKEQRAGAEFEESAEGADDAAGSRNEAAPDADQLSSDEVSVENVRGEQHAHVNEEVVGKTVDELQDGEADDDQCRDGEQETAAEVVQEDRAKERRKTP
ncbi:hypothetical protein HPB52_021259 [Rhipicephalus sanguineus]|uniref:Uncharacterized protein n=1 Tax=Rhipicephalus sanguineus TaxID=34632 RepID=A0A9D4T230_RHISA|nr:hypothetical protein HPB52_021259 [Rhipicephalus sanguineus]